MDVTVYFHIPASLNKSQSQDSQEFLVSKGKVQHKHKYDPFAALPQTEADLENHLTPEAGW